MKSVFTIINCLFVVLTAYFSVDIVYKKAIPETGTIAAAKYQQKSLAKQRPVNKKSTSDKVQNQLISKRNLFNVELEHKADKTEKQDEIIPEKLEPTHLQLVLWGTVTGQNEKYAVIEDKKARQQSLYLVGDTIQEAKLKEILRHKVVLTFQGKDQVLEMETKNKSVTKRQKFTPPAPSIQPSAMPSFEKMVENAGDLMRQIKFRPHYSEGEPDGLMVYGIRPNSVFREVGLRNGDIVKEVNGTPISSPEDAVDMFSEIVNSEQARVTLLRRGKIEELVYQMDGEPDSGTAVIEEKN